jgi:hypothetical protein
MPWQRLTELEPRQPSFIDIGQAQPLRSIGDRRLPHLASKVGAQADADIADLGEEHGHHVLRVRGKSTKVVLVPLPPAVGRAIDPPPDAMEILGHSRIAVTLEVYTAGDDRSRREATGMLADLLGSQTG